ncbi:Putative transport protein YhhT [Baekduia alba]|uniref:AI-2E family transporter n=1 Tax=Baekduia alba TaxID=2997333 RepID=UPI002341865B|nr:AI-2E family transporter [Baekduia alba]WCB94667.1 Putative transport protein YhhT [Baekduia alba]
MPPGRTTTTPAEGTPHRVGGPASATRSSDAVRAVLLAASLVGGYLLFSQLASLFVLVIITIVLSLPLEAAASRLQRHGVPRALGALVALVAMVAVVVGVLVVAIPPFVDELQRLADQLPQIIDQLGEKLGAKHSASTGDSLQRSLQDVLDKPQSLLGPIATVGLSVAGAVGAIIVVVVGAFYMAVNPGPLVDGAVRLFPPDRRGWVTDALAEIRSTWIGWQYGVVADMLVTGLLLYIGLTLVGLDYAFAFSVLSALCVVVPYFGSVAGGVPPVLYALAERGPTTALITLGVYLVVQQVEGNIIIPMVMSRAVKLHPAVVLIGVVLVGQLLGFVGLIVAVPIISATIVIVRELWVRRLEGDAPMPPARPPAAA